eukprot:4734295-Amphidinium_carterae.1
MGQTNQNLFGWELNTRRRPSTFASFACTLSGTRQSYIVNSITSPMHVSLLILARLLCEARHESCAGSKSSKYHQSGSNMFCVQHEQCELKQPTSLVYFCSKGGGPKKCHIHLYSTRSYAVMDDSAQHTYQNGKTSSCSAGDSNGHVNPCIDYVL